MKSNMKYQVKIKFSFEYYFLPNWLPQIVDLLKKSLVNEIVDGYDIVNEMVHIHIYTNAPFDTCEKIKEALKDEFVSLNVSIDYREIKSEEDYIRLWPKEFFVGDKIGKNYLIEQDFLDHAIWFRDERDQDDLIYPVYSCDDFPDFMNHYDLRIRAVFTSPSGMEFNGYIVGINYIYCIALFWNNEKLSMNKNMLNSCLKSIEKINQTLEEKINPEDLFPLKYRTTIDLEHFKVVSGEFDIFKKRTEEERMAGYF